MVDPHNPAFVQFPGFNRTFDEYMHLAEHLVSQKGSSQAKSGRGVRARVNGGDNCGGGGGGGSNGGASGTKLFLMSDDAVWVRDHLRKQKIVLASGHGSRGGRGGRSTRGGGGEDESVGMSGSTMSSKRTTALQVAMLAGHGLMGTVSRTNGFLYK
jgi:hypothetical protein